MIRALAHPVLSVLFPQECRVCSHEVEDRRDGNACRSCWGKTRIFTGNELLCDKCGAFFSDTAAAVPVLCHKCDEHKYDKAFAVGVYEKGLSAAILSLKTDPHISHRTRDLARAALLRLSVKPDIVIPIPLSKMRRVERGYNQAEILARLVGRTAGVGVDGLSVARTSHTPIHRVGMDQRARELTVQKAFRVERPKLIGGRRILLVDDVLTSGSTASACAAVLKKNGAARVDIFTLARAVMN